MAAPVVAALRTKYPDSSLSVLAGSLVTPLWAEQPGVDEVLPLSLLQPTVRAVRAGQFDLAVILPHSFRAALEIWLSRVPRRLGYRAECRAWLLTDAIPVPSGGFRKKHLTDEYLDLLFPLGIKDQARQPVLRATAAGRREAEDLLKKRGITEAFLTALIPGATYGPAKRWPVARFITAGWELSRRFGGRILVLGSAGDRVITDQVTAGIGAAAVGLAGELSLAGLAGLLEHCRLAVSNDTGPMHLAAALGVPTIGIFGSTSPDWTAPRGGRIRVLYGHPACGPCFRRDCGRNYECLSAISVEEVVKAAETLTAAARV
jgi:heptosyltransferase-2